MDTSGMCNSRPTCLSRQVDHNQPPLRQACQLHHQRSLAAAGAPLQQHSTATLGHSCQLLQPVEGGWGVGQGGGVFSYVVPCTNQDMPSP